MLKSIYQATPYFLLFYILAISCPVEGGVVSSNAAQAYSQKALKEIETDIKINKQAIKALNQEAQKISSSYLLIELHMQIEALEEEQRFLETQYQAIKTRIETEHKMREESIERSFKINP